MSASNVKAFFTQVEKDKTLQAKLKALQKKTLTESEKKATAEVVKIASAAGFKFTASSLVQARAGKGGNRPGAELSEVTGQEDCGWGVNYFCINYICGYYCYNT
jgi:predicted ribosomally synthesized peptide with nif11-like leader